MDDEKLINEILQDIENEEKDENIPVIENQTAEKDLKKQEKEKTKKERQKKYPDKIAFLVGIIVFVFAVIGIVLTVVSAVQFFNGEDEKNEFAEYNTYLTPIAAVDVDTFDDITAADKEQLLNSAIWLILSKDSTPDTYPYQNGYMLIPEKDVEASYISIFGPETAQKFTHMTVQGYNSTFEYDETNGVYKIPVTTISPVYIPNVTAVEQSGTALVITAEYLAAESWVRDDEGNFVSPEPDKVMQITLRELQGSYYISAIRTISSTVPEVIVDELTTSEPSSQPDKPENTTVPEKHTLGGRV